MNNKLIRLASPLIMMQLEQLSENCKKSILYSDFMNYTTTISKDTSKEYKQAIENIIIYLNSIGLLKLSVSPNGMIIEMKPAILKGGFIYAN
ncbi:hypothetical protein [Pseudostreptobacillus hongkongensis]|uniref:hypothetical protein n=1 Tax=Pseudostreptobacillus hongkongensis TaxID=1162717 RepID=UPI0008373C2D|nr:hypothetical protein [Pseudostreptobacillus hongkongensis]